MDNETINLIAQFMLRVDLKGHEVPAFNTAMNALETLHTVQPDDPDNLPYTDNPRDHN